MTLSTTENNELRLSDCDHRGAALARSLGARKMRRGGVLAFYLPGRRGEQFTLLYNAGFHACRRGGRVQYRRDPKPLHLYDALAVARAISGLATNCGLTANGATEQNPAHD